MGRRPCAATVSAPMIALPESASSNSIQHLGLHQQQRPGRLRRLQQVVDGLDHPVVEIPVRVPQILDRPAAAADSSDDTALRQLRGVRLRPAALPAHRSAQRSRAERNPLGADGGVDHRAIHEQAARPAPQRRGASVRRVARQVVDGGDEAPHDLIRASARPHRRRADQRAERFGQLRRRSPPPAAMARRGAAGSSSGCSHPAVPVGAAGCRSEACGGASSAAAGASAAGERCQYHQRHRRPAPAPAPAPPRCAASGVLGSPSSGACPGTSLAARVRFRWTSSSEMRGRRDAGNTRRLPERLRPHLGQPLAHLVRKSARHARSRGPRAARRLRARAAARSRPAGVRYIPHSGRAPSARAPPARRCAHPCARCRQPPISASELVADFWSAQQFAARCVAAAECSRARELGFDRGLLRR